MQDVVAAGRALITEAKLTAGERPAPSSPAIDVRGVLDVRGAEDVYLDLPVSDVASLVRQGTDLVLINAQGEQLRLQGFFADHLDRKLFLEDRGGHSVVVETAQALSDGPLTLSIAPTGELSPFTSLTGMHAAAAVATSAGGLGVEGVAAAALLGGLAAGGMGSGGGGSEPKPNPPSGADTVPPTAPTNLVFNPTGRQVTGNGEVGAVVTIRTATGTVIGTGVVDANGRFVVDLTQPVVDGQTVTVTLTDGAGNVSPTGSVQSPDTTPPAQPGQVAVTGGGATVTGTGEPGATVTVRNAGGTVIGTGTVGANGSFSVTLATPLTNGETVNVTLTDAAGNVSTAGTAQAADTTPPAQPGQIAVTGGGATVTGTGEPGSTVTVRGAGGTVIGTGTVGANGSFSVTLTTPVTNDQPVSVTLTDAAGNVSTAATSQAGDTTPPAQPGQVVVTDGGATVTGTGEPGAIVRIRIARGVIGTGTVGADGTFSVTLDTPLTNGETVSVTLTDAAGNVSTATTSQAGDTTPPAPPSQIGVTGAGTTVTGNGEPGATVTVRSAAGAVIGTGAVGADGTFSVTLATPLTNGQAVSVVLTDAAGNVSQPGTGQASDTTPPAQPDNVGVSATGAVVTGNGEPGATVTVRGTGGVVIGTGTVAADGAFSVTLTTAQTNGETVSVTLADAAGNVSLPGTALAPDLTVPGGPNGTDAPVLTIGEGEFGINAAELADGIQTRVALTPGTQVGDRVILTVTFNGATQTFEHVLVASEIAAGGAEVVLPSTFVAGSYSVTAVIDDGRGGRSGVSNTVNLLLDLSTSVPVITTANGAGLSGTAEAGATVTLLSAAGTPVVGANGQPVTATVAADGTWSLPGGAVPGGLNGFTGSVRATDPAGNTAQAGVGPVDGTTPSPIITAQNGLGVQGTAEIGATVTLLNSSGQPVTGTNGQPVTATVDATGHWSIPASAVPSGLDGFTGSVRAIDDAGNVATSPVGPIDGDITLSLNIDAVTSDNIINIAEAGSASVTVTGSALGDFTAGETVTVTLSNGVSRSATLSATGTWSVSFAGSDLAASTSITATSTATDAAGNSVTLSDVQTYTVDLTPPSAPLIIAANGAVVSGSGEIGSSISLLGAGGTVLATTVVGGDGRWSIAASAVASGLNGFSGTVQAADPAGNTSTTTVGPIDGTTAVPVITTANGASLSGTAEAGATITLLNASGQPVLGAGGQPITATVAANGTWTLPGGSVPGGLDGFTGSVRAVDAAGNIASGAVGPVDGATPAPIITGANGGGISGVAEPGAVILLDSNGVPVIGTNGQPVRTTVAADGTFNIPASAVPGGLNGFTGSVQAVDAAGNASATSVGPINGTVPLSLTIDAVTADNVLNLAESQGSVTLTGRAVGVFQVGERVTITLADQSVLTTTLGADGSWSVVASGAALAAGGSVSAFTVAVDTAGSPATVSTVRTYTVDLVATAPIIADANGQEIAGRAEAGDLIALINGAGVVVATVTAGFDGSWRFPASAVTGGLDGFSGTVRATDPAGNTASAAVGVIDGSTSTPVITTANGSGLSGTAEAGATVTLLSAAGTPVVGANGQPVTATVAADGTWTLPGGAVPGGLNGFTGSVRATDPAGNTAQAGVGPVDGTTPSPIITAQNGLGVQGTAEAGATVTLLNSSGQSVTGTNGQPVTATVDATGHWSIPASAVPGGLDGFTGSVRAIDGAGNAATSPVGPIDGDITLSLNIDAVTSDNIINIAEAGSASVTVTGSALGDFTAGETVTVTLSNGVSRSATLSATGTWSVSFAGSDLAASTSITATSTATDAAGNSVTLSDVQTYTVDLTPPSAPLIIAANGAVVSGSGEIGSSISLLGAGGTVLATTVVGGDGRWSIAASAVASGLNGFSGTVQAADPAGNTATTGVGPIDGTTSVPVITTANGAGLSGTAEAGATITLLNASGQPVLGAGGQPITAVVGVNGTWTLPGGAIPGGLDGFTGSVRAVDAAGNIASGAVGPVDGSTLAPIITGANGSGLFGSAEAGATVTLLNGSGQPVLGAGGQPITVTVGANGTFTIPASVVPGGLSGFTGSVQAVDAAGNSAATSVGPVVGNAQLTLSIDAITADNVINGAEAVQGAISVTGRAVGDVVAGMSIRVELSTGVSQVVTLAANGTWSASFTGAQLRAATSVTATATATDGAGNTITVSDVHAYAVDLTTSNPVITTANGAGLSGTAEAGAVITIRDASGQTVGSTTANASGAWTIAASGLSVSLDGFTGSVQAADAAGNTAASPLGPVDGRVQLLLGVNPITSDNILNIAEAATASVTVGGTATGEYRAGDVVTVTLSSGVSQTATLAANGTWSMTFTGAQLAAATGLTASVTTTDAAGNTATVTQNSLYGVDLVAPTAPVLTLAGALGLSGSGEPGSTVQLRDSAGVVLLNGSGQPITAVVGVNGAWTIPAAAFPSGAVAANFTGRLTAVDAAGNVSASTTIPLIDLTPPSSATTSVSIDVIAGDDIVNLAESRNPVTITGRVTGEFRAGDPVTVTAGVATFVGVIGADGRWSIVAPGAALTGGTLQASVLASDAAGNTGLISGTRPYVLDIQGPGGVTGLAAPGLGIAAAADGLISPTELSGGVSAVVTLTPSTQVGDTVTLTLNHGGTIQTLTAVVTSTLLAAGQVSFTITPGLTDGQYTASAVIGDPSGNVSAPSTTLSFLVDAIPISLTSTTAAVSEAALGQAATGTVAIAGATGTATFSLQAPSTTVTSHGQTVTWGYDGTGTLVGSAGGQTIIRATINGSGQYSISLLGPLDHSGAGADVLQLPIGVSVTDSDGTARGVITLGVTDTVPLMAAPAVLSPVQPGVIVGDFVQSFGADGGRVTSVTVDGRTFAYNPTSGSLSVSGSNSTLLSYGVQGGVLSATTVRGEAISIDFATGRYQVQVSGQPATTAASIRPDVYIGGGNALLGLLDANVLGLIQLNQQQLFSVSDANNDINQVVVRYTAALSIGAKTFGYNAALAAELGLSVVQANTAALSSSSQLTITAIGGGPVDNLKLNEFLGSITIAGGLAGLLGLAVAQSLSIQATDAAGHVTLATENSLASLSLLSNLLGSAQPTQIMVGASAGDVLTGSDVGVGVQLDNRIYGYDGNDTLSGGLGNDLLRGGSGNDILLGGSGNDLLIGGTGNDTLTGGTGADVFRWEAGDQGTVAQPAADIITDFNAASIALGGDVLDLSGLLIGEGRIGTNAGNLSNYLHFEQTALGTLIHVSTTGGFVGGYGSATSTGGAGNQTILLSNVNLTAGFGSDQAIISSLLSRGNLIVDSLSTNGSTAGNLVIGSNVVDGDGDTGSTSLTIDGSRVTTPSVAGNVAPVVEASAQTVLGLIGVAAAGLNLNSQDLLAADANGNLARVVVEYAPLVALNLTPLTFGYSTSLAASYGLNVLVTQSNGLLGVVAPGARIEITALDGGVLDNVRINQFLQTVHLADTGGGLLSSSLLSVGLLNSLTITAVDAQGLSSSAAVGSVVSINALHSLNTVNPGPSSSPVMAESFHEATGKTNTGAEGALGGEDQTAGGHAGGTTHLTGGDDPLVIPAADDPVGSKGSSDGPHVLPALEDDTITLHGWMDEVGSLSVETHDGWVRGEDVSFATDHAMISAMVEGYEDLPLGAPDPNGDGPCVNPGPEGDPGIETFLDLTGGLVGGDDFIISPDDGPGGLERALTVVEAGGYDAYMPPLPPIEDPGMVNHP